jgi:hypothetical protein
VFGEWRCEKRWSIKFLWFVGFVIGGDDLMKEEGVGQRICFVLFFTRPERQQKAGCCCFMRLWGSFRMEDWKRALAVLKSCSERKREEYPSHMDCFDCTVVLQQSWAGKTH